MSKKIKSIRRFNQNYKNFSFADLTNRADEEFLEMNITIDENGNTTEESKFDHDGELEEKNSFEFDKNGKLLSHTLLYAVDDVTEKRKLERNEKGLLIAETKFYGDDSGEKTTYEYDDKDNIISITKYDEEGEFISREEVKYDDKGSLSERCTYNADRKQLSRMTFATLPDNKIEEQEFDDKNNLTSKTLISFNDKGKEESTVQTNPQGKLISRVTVTYDENGNVIRRDYKDFYSKSVLYTYNEKNLVTSQELFDDNGLLLRKNLYEYDDDGNVIAEQTYEMDTSRGGRDKHFGTRYEYEFY